MAVPAITITEKNKVVAFAVLTGKGRKGKKDENEYTVAVEMSKKEKDRFIKEVTKFWDDEKSNKSKEPKEPFEKWFTESKSVKGGFVLWVSEVISSKLTRKKASGTSFGLDEFANLGSGSKVDVEIRLFLYDNSYGSGIGMRLSAVQLNEFVKYTGGGGASLGGDTIDDEGIEETAPASESDEAVAEFHEAIADGDFADAKEILNDELKSHPDFKKFKKELKKAKGK